MEKQDIAARCHDIQACLGNKEVPEFEAISQIGMAVRLALHIKGLPRIKYNVLKLAANYYLNIPSLVLQSILEILYEVQFVKILSQGQTIQTIIPTVPFFEDIYESIGDFAAKEKSFNEAEQLSLEILKRLTLTPEPKQTLYNIGADSQLINRSVQIGDEGGYFRVYRARGKDIIYSPIFFSENANLYADIVAKSGAKNVKRLLDLIKRSQGWPLSIIEKMKEINGFKVTDDEIKFLKRLAQDGAVKPPSISTSHSGENYFIFTPSPGLIRLTPAKREIYERAMALVASVRQGQFLPKKYAIRSPYAILTALRDKGFLNANTEALEQYKKLTVLRVGRLEETSPGSGWFRFYLNDVEESQEVLSMAIDLVSQGQAIGTEIDEEFRIAVQKDQLFIESLLSSQKLKERETISYTEDQKEEIDNLFLRGDLK